MVQPLPFQAPQNGCMKQSLGRGGADVCILFQIEMFQTTVAGVMEQYHNQHDFCL